MEEILKIVAASRDAYAKTKRLGLSEEEAILRISKHLQAVTKLDAISALVAAKTAYDCEQSATHLP